MDQALIFLHIAKAGGTTFERVLERVYPPAVTYALDNWDTLAAIERLRQTPPENLRHVRLLKGHMPFGLHQLLPVPAQYITFLRDPVERIISMYYFIRRTPGHYLHQAVMEQQLDIEQFVQSGLSPELDNGQVKAISGNYTHYGCCSQADLELARKNVHESFAAVGITERYNESLLIMKERLRWTAWPYYESANVTSNRPMREALPPAAVTAIHDVNALDVELYQWALDRHRTTMAAMGPAFKLKLAAFSLGQKLRL